MLVGRKEKGDLVIPDFDVVRTIKVPETYLSGQLFSLQGFPDATDQRKGSTMNSRQNLDFVLLRSPHFNGNEKAVLGYINSFSSFCAPFTLKQMASDFHWSERKLRYVIKSLVLKGIVKRTYRCFKKLRLEIISLAQQKFLHGAGMGKKIFDNVMKLKKKSSHRQTSAELIRQSSAEPIQNKTEENKTLNTGLVFSKNRIELSDTDLAIRRDAMLAEFYAKCMPKN